MADVAWPIMELLATGEHTRMAQTATEYCFGPGYDFGAEFEFGLDLIPRRSGARLADER